MCKSYIVAYTIFPKNYGTFKTKFNVFTDYKFAINFYKRINTDNKVFYESVELERGS